MKKSKKDYGKSTATCLQCGSSRECKRGRDGLPSCPMGWKRLPSGLHCGKCWHKSYALRAITVPVAGPVGGKWEPLREALKAAWADCARFSNLCVQSLYAAEPPRGESLGKLPRVDLYGLYRDRKDEWPAISSGTVVALCHSVEGRYRKARWDCVWRRAQALPTYRYPTPLPIRSQDWTITEDGGVFGVSVPIAGERHVLRLRGGHNFRRQLSGLRQITTGEAIQAELALYQVSGSSGDHRPRLEGREPGGGTRALSKLLCKIVAWLPRHERGDRSGQLLVRTDPDSLLVYSVAGAGEQSVLRINGDHVRRWIAEHRRRLDRTSDDLKAERRSGVGRPCPPVLDQRQRWATRQHRRLDSFTHEASAQIASFAARQNVATVVYDDRDKRFVDKFPWAELQSKLRYKLDAEGIGLELAEEAVAK